MQSCGQSAQAPAADPARGRQVRVHLPALWIDLRRYDSEGRTAKPQADVKRPALRREALGNPRPIGFDAEVNQPIACAEDGSISNSTRTSPGCANGYLSLPRYFLASESICASAPFSVSLTTFPRIWI